MDWESGAHRGGPKSAATWKDRRVTGELARTEPFSFSYQDFEKWYAREKRDVLDPACADIKRVLDQAIDKELGDLERHRIRTPTSRVKSIPRLWGKIEGYSRVNVYEVPSRDSDGVLM
jgi:hypothetical protein